MAFIKKTKARLQKSHEKNTYRKIHVKFDCSLIICNNYMHTVLACVSQTDSFLKILRKLLKCMYSKNLTLFSFVCVHLYFKPKNLAQPIIPGQFRHNNM